MIALLLCSSVSLGYAFISCLCVLCGFAVQGFVISAAVLTLPAMQCRLRRSSAIFPHCRRVYATTVAVPVFAAASLRIFARKIRKSVARLVLAAVHFGDNFAIIANRSSFTSTTLQPSAAILPQLLLRPHLPQQLRLFVARNHPFLRFRRSCQVFQLHDGRIFAAQPAPTAANNRSYCIVFTLHSVL